jgi:serine/threonine protein kinase
MHLIICLFLIFFSYFCSYASSSQLTEKSDVYSFGVVLLEIVTGKPPTGQGLQKDQHLTDFVQKTLSKGNIESILDPHMGSQFNLNSVWKVADLALRCIANPAKRPDMTEVVIELSDSLNLEMSSTQTSNIAWRVTNEYSGYSRNDNSVGDVNTRSNFEMAHIGEMGITDYLPLPR